MVVQVRGYFLVNSDANLEDLRVAHLAMLAGGTLEPGLRGVRELELDDHRPIRDR